MLDHDPTKKLLICNTGFLIPVPVLITVRYFFCRKPELSESEDKLLGPDLQKRAAPPNLHNFASCKNCLMCRFTVTVLLAVNNFIQKMEIFLKSSVLVVEIS